MMKDLNQPPINPLPSTVWILAIPMVAAELVFNLGNSGVLGGAQAIGWRSAALESYGIWPAYWREQASFGAFDPELIGRFFTFSFVHFEITHALFAVVILLALGKVVGEVFRPVATFVLYTVSAAFGALVYASIPAITLPLAGAYPGDYGLIGGFTFLIWVRLAGTGVSQLRAFSMIGFLLGVQLVWGVLFGGGADWVADVAAFAAGFALSFLLTPGGIAKARARLRHR